MTQTISDNLRAFLDMIAKSEGTSTSKYTKDNGYDIVVDGKDSPHRFSSYLSHPAVLVHVREGLSSTAAGRYQLLYRYWVAYKDQLNLPDFSPASQDKIAIQQIKECKALGDIEGGNLDASIKKCGRIWASLPHNEYGQPSHSLAKLTTWYKEAGGTIAV